MELILAGASITNSTSSPLYVTNASAVTVTLAAGTSNNLTDAATYTNTGEPDSALFSAADLTIGGTGSLTVRANYADGIVSKDDLVIQSGTIDRDAVDDASSARTTSPHRRHVTVTRPAATAQVQQHRGRRHGLRPVTEAESRSSVADDAIKGEKY